MTMLGTLYKELLSNEELLDEMAAIVKDKETLLGFLHDHGCDTTWEEYRSFMVETRLAARWLSDDELDAVAGGAEEVDWSDPAARLFWLPFGDLAGMP